LRVAGSVLLAEERDLGEERFQERPQLPGVVLPQMVVEPGPPRAVDGPVRRRDDGDAPGGEDPERLREETGRVREVLDHLEGGDRVEAVVEEREGERVARDGADPRRLEGRRAGDERIGGVVQAHGAPRRAGDEGEAVPRPAADVKQVPARAEGAREQVPRAGRVDDRGARRRGERTLAGVAPPPSDPPAVHRPPPASRPARRAPTSRGGSSRAGASPPR